MNRGPSLLAVLGCGAVMPDGLGVAALHASPAKPVHEALLSNPERSVPVRRVDLAGLHRWTLEPRLRRAGPLALFLAEAARQALAHCPDLPRNRLGLVAALGTGSIRFSREFYARAMTRGRALAAPAVFPETVYNSPVSHVAALLGIEGACYTLVGDETALVEALRVAQVWLARRTADAVLVLAGEELDPIALEAYARLGWFRRGLVATEGAASLLVTPADAAGPTPARLHPGTSPVSFLSRAEQMEAWKQVAAADAQPLVLPAHVVAESLATELLPNAPRLAPDHGFAFTASAAWSCLQAVTRRSSGGPFRLLAPGATTAVDAVYFP